MTWCFMYFQVEFVTGTKKTKTDISAALDDKKRKTKWDSEASGPTRAGNVAAAINQTVANLTSSATGTKSTVIPATGNITKKPSK